MKAMPSRDKLAEFLQWCESHIKGDEKGESQIFLDRLFQTFDQPGTLVLAGLAYLSWAIYASGHGLDWLPCWTRGISPREFFPQRSSSPHASWLGGFGG